MNKQLIVLFFVLVPAFTAAAELKLTPAQLANVNLATASANARESQTNLQLNGVLTADQRKTHRVAPVVEGIVMALQVVAHEQVHKGQILARLRSHSLGQAQAEYLDALARFELAKSERTRIEGLWKDGIVAESRWLKVDSEYKSSRATLEARRRLLSLTGLSDEQINRLSKQPTQLAEFNLISPIDGVVTAVDIESGQLLNAGQAAFHLDDLSALWAMVKIPVASLPQVKPGIEAEIRVQASPDRPYYGKLESLGSEVDAASQTLTGRIVLANPDRQLLPGMYAQVSLTGVSSQELMVPAGAVFRVALRTMYLKHWEMDVLNLLRLKPVSSQVAGYLLLAASL